MGKYIVTLSLLVPLLASGAIKIVCGPILQNVGEDSATIVWATDVDAMSWVEVAPADGSHFYAKERPKFFDAPMGKKQIGKLHKVTVKGLEKGKKYNYRVFSREVVGTEYTNIFYGKVASTRVYQKVPPSLETLDNSKKGMKFSVVNDIHGDNNKLKALLSTAENDDFLVFNGDMVTSIMSSPQQLYKDFLLTTTEATKSSKPILFSRGNHETRGGHSESYMDYFPTNTGKPYYTKKIRDAFFVFLDSGEDKPDNDIEYSDSADFDNYRIEQAKWLAEVLESPDYKNAIYKIVVVHIPPSWGDWHGSIHFRKVFAPVLKGKKVDLYLSGHLHEYAFYPADENFDAPNIANSDAEIMNISLENDTITVKFKDVDGKQSRPDFVIKK